MQFLKALFALPLVSAVALKRGDWQDSSCLTDADAQYLISQSIVFLEHKDVPAAKAAAYTIFTEDIQEFGDSINSLRGDPVSHPNRHSWGQKLTNPQLGTQVENGLTQYVNETTSQPPIPSITTLDYFFGCNQLLWQWQFDLGLPAPSPNMHVNGVTIAKVNSDKKIYHQYIEFNSLAWAIDVGFTVTPPAGGLGG